MENPQPSFLQRLTGSPVLLISGVVVLLLILIVSGVFLFLQKSESKPPLDPIPQDALYMADEIVVKFSEGYLPSPQGENPKWDKLHEKLTALGVEKFEPVFDSKDPSLQYHYRLTLKEGSDVEKIREEIYKLDEIKSSEPNYFFQTQSVPNDSLYPSMWDLQKIQMENAWNIQTGSNAVTVAVIDTGVDYTHPDFAGRTFVQGKDFVTCNNYIIDDKTMRIIRCLESKQMDNDPIDDQGHGTHVTGTIGAVSNNGEGISGINWEVSLMALKTMNKQGLGGEGITNAILYATDNGADVINMSLGGPGTCSQNSAYQAAINYAVDKGVVVVVAAGNSNQDASTFMPANCKGVIVVGATGLNDERASYSNYGSIVTLAAPGGNKVGQDCSPTTCITSTVLGGKYSMMAGTSMASPHVAGVVALLLAQNSSLTPDDVKRCLVESADPISTDKPIGGKRLNAYKALNGCVKSSNPGVTTGVTPGVTITSSPSSNGDLSYYIKGEAYIDKNKNGKKDADETTLEGAVVRLSGPVSRDPIQVGPDGLFMFSGLEPGSYQVETFVNNVSVMEYRFRLNTTLPNIELPVPVMFTPPQDTKPDTSGQNPVTGKTTVTPTPRQLFTCKEETTNRQVNNKTIQIKYLKCTPKQ